MVNPQQAALAAACTRTLAGAESPLHLTAPMLEGVYRWRLHSDRLALGQRFHHPLWDQLRPSDEAAASCFDLICQARGATLGEAQLPGVGVTMRRCMGGLSPLSPQEALYLLASGVFRQGDVPPTPAWRALLERLGADALHQLSALGALLTDPAGFAHALATWSQNHAHRLASLEVEEGSEGALEGQAQPLASSPPSSGEGGDVPQPDAEAPQGRGGGCSAEPHRHASGYRVYDNTYDQQLAAESLVPAARLAELHASLEQDLQAQQPAMRRIARRLRNRLLARQRHRWCFDQEEGLLDPARLACLVGQSQCSRIFKQEQPGPRRDTCVTLLIDNSGSMAGRPARMAAKTVDLLVQALETCGIGVEVLGYTTRDWDGGIPGQHWQQAGAPRGVGRIAPRLHIVYKSANAPWRRGRRGLGVMLETSLLKENLDGEALLWAAGRLARRPEEVKILLVISDGAPMDEKTLEANGRDYLENHLRTVTAALEANPLIRLAAIGLRHNLARYYRNALTLTHEEQLTAQLSASLWQLLKGEPVKGGWSPDRH